MGAQDRSRRHGTDFSLETKLNRVSFPRVRYHANNFFRIQNLTHRHGNGSPGNFRNIGEPSLANLMATADFVTASRKSNWDVPVATTIRACPRSVIARRTAAAACSAAALLRDILSSYTRTITL